MEVISKDFKMEEQEELLPYNMKVVLTKDNDILEKERDTKCMKTATVEEALKYTGFGKYNFGLLMVCSWTLQAMGVVLFGSSFPITAAVCDLDLSMQQRALLTATPMIGAVVGAHLWGYTADTKGRKLTLLISMSMGFVFGALNSLAPGWKTMALFLLLSSTFTSASNSASYTLLGESCDIRVRGRAMLLCTCALMCSQATAAVLAYPILPLGFSFDISFLNVTFTPWRLLLLILSLPCAATTCLLPLFYESPKFLMSRGRHEEALDVLKKIYAVNSGKQADDFPVKKLVVDESEPLPDVNKTFFQALWNQTVPLFTPPLLKKTLHLFYIVVMIYMTGSGFILWLPYIMNSLFTVIEAGGGMGMNLCSVIRVSQEGIKNVNSTITNLSTSQIEQCDNTIQDSTLFIAMIYGALASSTNLVLSLTVGNRKRIAMLGILFISTLAAVLLNAVRIPIAGGIFFLFFLMCALSMGILSVYFVELYPTNLRGMASCLSVMVGRLAAFGGANLIAPLITWNCEATFYAWAVLILSAMIFTWFLPKDKMPEK